MPLGLFVLVNGREKEDRSNLVAQYRRALVEFSQHILQLNKKVEQNKQHNNHNHFDKIA